MINYLLMRGDNMNFNIINYMGIDYENNKKYAYKFPYKIDGVLNMDKDLYELLSFSISKENLGYKVIDFFNDSNFDNELYFGNLIIITNHFQLNFEYALSDNPTKINYSNHNIYHAIHISIPNYNNEDLNIKPYICDLFCSLLEDNNIYYSIGVMLCINKN